MVTLSQHSITNDCWSWYIPAAGLALVHDLPQVFQLLLPWCVAGADVSEGKHPVRLSKDVKSSGLQPKPSNAWSRCNGLACSLVAFKDGGKTGPQKPFYLALQPPAGMSAEMDKAC